MAKFVRYDQGVAGGILSSPQFVQQFDNLSQVMHGVITSTYHLGCTFGALSMFFIGNHGGKKCIVFRYFAHLTDWADARVHNDDFGEYPAGFFISTNSTYIRSCGNGLGKWNEHVRYSDVASRNVASANPSGVSEYPNIVRYPWLGANERFIIFGIALANWVCFGVSSIPSSIQWHFPLVFLSVFAIIVISALPFLPE
jgi:hypothetical protein